MQKAVYALYFEYDGDKVPFYVGCSNNIDRREKEHKRNAYLKAEYNTNKYRFIRELDATETTWWLEILTEEFDVDEKTDEYSWILQLAEDNRVAGLGDAFWGYPLTNMKAGDFVSEMLADKEYNDYSPAGVKAYRKELTMEARHHNYTRFKGFDNERNPAIAAIQQLGKENSVKNREERIKLLRRQVNESESILAVRESKVHKEMLADALRELALLENDLFE